MTTGRYVVLGLAQARAVWFRSVAQWANAASLPVEFVKCVSAEEVRARLAAGRPFSALLVDGTLPSLDRDVIDVARRVGCAVVVVADPRVDRDWAALGADAVLSPEFGRDQLLGALAGCAHPISRQDTVPVPLDEPPAPAWQAPVATVCGPGGTGASSSAMALAQGLADDTRTTGLVLLADLARRADQAMLHDARDVVPGVQELVEAHRSGRPPAEEVRSLAFRVEARGYNLLLGLRRPRAWSSIRPRAFEAAFDALRRSYRVVVCDVDGDLEGEAEGGSMDVEERNVMSRTAASRADVVFAVGLPGMKGTHSLAGLVADLVGIGVAPARIVPVVNRAPRSGRARSEVEHALSTLVASVTDEPLRPVVHLPERRVDDAVRDGVRLPSVVVQPLVTAWLEARRATTPPASSDEPRRVAPGSIGSWAS